MAELIPVAAVDDDRMLLEGMAAWSARSESWRLIGSATTVAELVDRHWPGFERPPAVTLLDLRLRDGSDPVGNVLRLRRAGTRVIVISTFADREQMLATIRVGADGYVTKDHDLLKLSEAIVGVARGRSAIGRELAFAWMSDRHPDRPALSAQERQVLVGYASGMTLASAARRAGISVNTAKQYLDRVKRKYQLAGRAAPTKLELAERVRQDGWGED